MPRTIGLFVPQSQIDSLNAGNAFTTCEPKLKLEKVDASIIPNRQQSIGHIYDVADETGEVRAKATLNDCFMMTFGNPDPKFVSGMGFGSDINRCKTEYEKFWKYNFPEEKLEDSTELFVTIWQGVK